jgi:acetylornithine deacetylase
LIRSRPVTGQEKDVQKLVVKKLETMDLELNVFEPDIERLKKHPAHVPVDIAFHKFETGYYDDRPNVVGICKGSGGGRSLLFNGHVDSNPIQEESKAAWRHDPWGGEVDDGSVYGRGASDMKGGVAAMTMALDCVLKAGVKLRGDVIMEYVVDEEVGGNGTLDCILRGYKADAGISCEASDMEVQPACTGCMQFEINVQGKSGWSPSAEPWEAVSAIEKGYRISQAVADYETIRSMDAHHPLWSTPRGGVGCFVAMFHSGILPHTLPDICVLKGRMSLLPKEDPKEIQEDFIKYIANAAKADPWLRGHPPKTRFMGYTGEATEIPVDHPICKNVIHSFKEALGTEPKVEGHDGGSDAWFLNKYGKTPTVTFGPGEIKDMHATDERVKIDNLIKSVKVLALSIINWCK